MSYPNVLVATELAAVNQILGAVGQAPVTTLDRTNPDVAIAYDTLHDVSREVQSEGWVFNTEVEYPFVADQNGEIIIADNVLLLDLSKTVQNAGIDTVRRQGKLYNKSAHTYKWEGEVLCDVVWCFEFNDLPPAFRDYIVIKASVQASAKLIGDETIYSMLQAKETLARANVIEYECNEGDYSFFGFPRGSTFYNSYQPYHTLAR